MDNNISYEPFHDNVVMVKLNVSTQSTQICKRHVFRVGKHRRNAEKKNEIKYVSISGKRENNQTTYLI